MNKRAFKYLLLVEKINYNVIIKNQSSNNVIKQKQI